MPKDSEIIAILRVIDINDDGVIDKTEFDYFIGLFSLRFASSEPVVTTKLRERSRKEHEVNYFGERRTDVGGLSSSQALVGGVTSSYTSTINREREYERKTGYGQAGALPSPSSRSRTRRSEIEVSQN